MLKTIIYFLKIKCGNLNGRTVCMKPKGQALLSVLVITTLSMLLLTGVAIRVDIHTENVSRSGNFDKTLVAGDSTMNDILRIINENPACQSMDDNNQVGFATDPSTLCRELAEYLNAINYNIDGTQYEIAFRTSDSSGASMGVELTPLTPLTLIVDPDPIDNVNYFLDKVKISSCKSSGTSGTPKVLISAVYEEFDSGSSQGYKQAEAIVDCNGSAEVGTAKNAGFRDYNGNFFGSYIERIKLIRIRLLDIHGNTPDSVTIDIAAYGGSLGGSGSSTIISRTTSFQVILSVKDDLGSSSVVAADFPTGSTINTTPAIFDFVYFRGF